MENLRIATWDIKNSYFKLWENNIKAACVTQLLTQHNLDVLALQEVNPVLARKIEENLRKLDKGYSITTSHKKVGINVVSNLSIEENIIISRLTPISSSYDTELPIHIKLTNPNTMRRRHLVGQEFEGNIYINNTHLDYVDNEVSECQMVEIIEELETQCIYNKESFLVGNLNKQPSETNMQQLTDILSTDIGMQVVENPHRTYINHEKDEPVDYVVIPSTWEATSVETVEGYETISTHRPVVVEARRIK